MFSDEMMIEEIPLIIFSLYLGVVLDSVSKVNFQSYFMESNLFLAFFDFFLDFMLVLFRPLTLFGRIFVFLLMNHVLALLFFEVFYNLDWGLSYFLFFLILFFYELGMVLAHTFVFMTLLIQYLAEVLF